MDGLLASDTSLAGTADVAAPAGETVTPPALATPDAAPAPEQGDTAVVPDAAKPAPAKPAAGEEPPAPGKQPTPPAKAADKAAVKDDEVVIADGEILDTVEEITKRFPNTSNGLRKYAASVGAQLKAAQMTLNIVENLGGQEGVELLVEYGNILTNPKGFPKFKEMLGEVAPFHLKELANDVLWNDVVKDEGKMELVIKELCGDNWTYAMMSQLVDAVEAGEIDLDEIREKSELKLSSKELAARNADRTAREKTENENKVLREQAQKVEDQATEQEVTKGKQLFVDAARTKWEPIAKRLGMLPVPGEPERVAKYRSQNLFRILSEVDDRLRGANGHAVDPDYEALYAMIEAKQTNTLAFKMKNAACANKAKAIFEQLATDQQEFFTGAISSFNGKEIGNIKRLQDEPSGAPSVASPKDAPTDEGEYVMDPVERKKRFAATMERELARVS